jgi:uncharacterized protein YqfA (UPF0365 family)
MPIPWRDRIAMSLRRSPVNEIAKALKVCESAGITATARDLESQYLCGQDPLALAEGLSSAKQLGIETSLKQMAAAQFMGHDLSKLLNEVLEDRRMKWDTFSPTRPDLIRGFTRDGVEVKASIAVVFSLTVPQATYGFTGRTVKERLGAAVSVFINTAADRTELERNRPSHEAQLRVLAQDELPGLRSLALSYT